MIHVLDTSAVIAFFRDEPGTETVERIFNQTGHPRYMHSANWIETVYKMREKGGERAAKLAMNGLDEYGVSVVDVTVEAFRLRVADIKSAYPCLALGDCFAIGLGGWLNGEVVTADKNFELAKAFARIKRIR